LVFTKETSAKKFHATIAEKNHAAKDKPGMLLCALSPKEKTNHKMHIMANGWTNAHMRPKIEPI
jgi:hypothetical protein